jgi:hypothetical protein
MKGKFTLYFVLLALPFAACIKTVIPIAPPPPGGSSSSTTGNIPYGISMYINGKFTTFNSGAKLDTSDNQFFIQGGGDSAGFTNLGLAMDMFTFDNAPVIAGMYVSSSFGTEYQGDFTLWAYGFADQNSVAFGGFPDTIIVTKITDTTLTGTFWGTCTADYPALPPAPPGTVDSTIYVTKGQFYLHK